MTETPPVKSVDVAHPAHNPFDVPRPRRNNGIIAAIVFAAIFHGIIGYYLYQWKFQAKFQSYADEKTDAALIHPPPPPPPRRRRHHRPRTCRPRRRFSRVRLR